MGVAHRSIRDGMVLERDHYYRRSRGHPKSAVSFSVHSSLLGTSFHWAGQDISVGEQRPAPLGVRIPLSARPQLKTLAPRLLQALISAATDLSLRRIATKALGPRYSSVAVRCKTLVCCGKGCSLGRLHSFCARLLPSSTFMHRQERSRIRWRCPYRPLPWKLGLGTGLHLNRAKARRRTISIPEAGETHAR